MQEEGLGDAEQELQELKQSLQDTQPVGVLVSCCKTLDQVKNIRCQMIVVRIFPSQIRLNIMLLGDGDAQRSLAGPLSKSCDKTVKLVGNKSLPVKKVHCVSHHRVRLC